MSRSSVESAFINAAAAVRDYSVEPRLEYKTISAVNGPLVILENVKSPQFGMSLYLIINLLRYLKFLIHILK